MSQRDEPPSVKHNLKRRWETTYTQQIEQDDLNPSDSSEEKTTNEVADSAPGRKPHRDQHKSNEMDPVISEPTSKDETSATPRKRPTSDVNSYELHTTPSKVATKEDVTGIIENAGPDSNPRPIEGNRPDARSIDDPDASNTLKRNNRAAQKSKYKKKVSVGLSNLLSAMKRNGFHVSTQVAALEEAAKELPLWTAMKRETEQSAGPSTSTFDAMTLRVFEQENITSSSEVPSTTVHNMFAHVNPLPAISPPQPTDSQPAKMSQRDEPPSVKHNLKRRWETTYTQQIEQDDLNPSDSSEEKTTNEVADSAPGRKPHRDQHKSNEMDPVISEPTSKDETSATPRKRPTSDVNSYELHTTPSKVATKEDVTGIIENAGPDSNPRPNEGNRPDARSIDDPDASNTLKCNNRAAQKSKYKKKVSVGLSNLLSAMKRNGFHVSTQVAALEEAAKELPLWAAMKRETEQSAGPSTSTFDAMTLRVFEQENITSSSEVPSTTVHNMFAHVNPLPAISPPQPTESQPTHMTHSEKIDDETDEEIDVED